MILFIQTWKETEELQPPDRFTVKGKGGLGGQGEEWIVLLTLHFLTAVDIVAWF